MEEPGRLQSMGSRSRTQLSDFTFTFDSHALEKEMATHSSVLAWRIPGTGEPGVLQSMGSHRVGHDWSDLAAQVLYIYVSAGVQEIHNRIELFLNCFWLQGPCSFNCDFSLGLKRVTHIKYHSYHSLKTRPCHSPLSLFFLLLTCPLLSLSLSVV